MPSEKLDISEGIIVVKVLFTGPKGQKLLDMVLDTGASITSIPYKTALDIGYDPANPDSRCEIITASGVEYVPNINVAQVDLMGFTLKDVEVTCLDLPPKSAVAGLLGLNVLSDFNVLLAFRDRLLELSK